DLVTGVQTCALPISPSLEETKRRAVAVEAGFEPFVPRVTMTRPVLAAAATMVYLVTGEAKADAVTRAFADPPDPATPASLIRGRSEERRAGEQGGGR